MRIIFCSLILVLCSGFVPYGDTALYQRSGRPKPIVAVMPVIDNTHDQSVCWDLSREFTEEICKRILDSSKLYLLEEGGNCEISKLFLEPNPYAIPIQAKAHLGAAEFVIVSELIEQNESPYGLNTQRPFLKETGATLSVALRLRVLDVRHEKPEVILQEVISYQHDVARPYLHCDYRKNHWGTQSFQRTPLGIVHGKLVREIVARAEGYIGAVKG